MPAASPRRGTKAGDADLVVFPELCVSGYPPEDLVLKDAFLDAVSQAVAELALETADGGSAMLIGAPVRDGGERRNAALLLDGGRVAATVLKHHLPNYGVFDEARVFVPADPARSRSSFRGVASRHDDLRGHVVPRRGGQPEGQAAPRS